MLQLILHDLIQDQGDRLAELRRTNLRHRRRDDLATPPVKNKTFEGIINMSSTTSSRPLRAILLTDEEACWLDRNCAKLTFINVHKNARKLLVQRTDPRRRPHSPGLWVLHREVTPEKTVPLVRSEEFPLGLGELQGELSWTFWMGSQFLAIALLMARTARQA